MTAAPVPSSNEYAATRPGDGGGAVLFTVTFTGTDVSRLPDASRARALTAYGPFETVNVFQEIEYGAVVSSAPRGEPFTRNCTPATASLSVAEAETVALDPERVAPAAGAVTETTGFVVSQFDVDALIVAFGEVLVARS